MDSRDTHVRAKVAIENRDRMRSALGIKDDFIDGTSFEKLNKSVDLKVDEIEKGDCKRKKKKSDEVKKHEKMRKTESSSSSSSSSEQSSSEDSSEFSSDSDDSSTNSTEESSENISSEVSEAKVRKKVSGRNLSEKTKESRRSYRHEVRHSCDRRNDGDGNSFSDREKYQRHNLPEYSDRSHHRQRHSDDHFDCRRSGRSYGYDDGRRREWCSRRYYRQNHLGNDRHRKHDRDEKSYQCQEEKRSHRRRHCSSDSDTDHRQKHRSADRNDDGSRKQLRKHSSSVEKKKRRRSKSEEVVPDTKDIKIEPASSPHSRSISSQKISSLMTPLESNRNTGNITPFSESSTAEIASGKKRAMDNDEMESDVRQSDTKIHSSIEDKEKVERSSGSKRGRYHSSEIHESVEKRYRHDTSESEDESQSSSSSNDEFLHQSGSTHSSTTTSNGGMVENILNDNSDEVHSPSHSPEQASETGDRNKKLGSESKFCRVESYKPRRHDCDRSVSCDRNHKLSKRKSRSNDSSRKRYRESRSRSHRSKRQISRSSSRSRHHRKCSSESRRSTSHCIRKSTSVSSRKQSYSPKNSSTKRSSASKSKKLKNPKNVKGSEDAESTNEVRVKCRHDTSSSRDEDSKDRGGKRSHRSSESSSRSSCSSELSVEKTGKHTNDFGRKRHR
ncbi:unnamed protein product [Acanthocheilonema viteae]|uniref:CWF21 domain-containing protein n=1 Tax=Acanthocheilonema viteae TaxID=6277 RepID=A0A498SQQ7_ACAVI|nr:unnamed protein product [Acanthocheilonema viteae]